MFTIWCYRTELKVQSHLLAYSVLQLVCDNHKLFLLRFKFRIVLLGVQCLSTGLQHGVHWLYIESIKMLSNVTKRWIILYNITRWSIFNSCKFTIIADESLGYKGLLQASLVLWSLVLISLIVSLGVRVRADMTFEINILWTWHKYKLINIIKTITF